MLDQFICQASLYARPIYMPGQFICEASLYARPLYMPGQFLQFIFIYTVYMPEVGYW